MRYTDLIFDLYGTLVDIHTEENAAVWEKTALYFGFYGAHYTGDALKSAFEAALRAREAKAGQSYECFPDIPFEQIMTELFVARGVTENADALGVNAAQLFRIQSIEYLRLYPHALEALARLREKGYRLWLLSNAQRVFTAYELRHLGLGDQLDGIYISSDYQCRKPDIRFFRALLEEQGLNPAACLMIGNDRATDVAGAQAAGLATLYMHTNLTPDHQAEADPALHPLKAPEGCRHFEYEGFDWQELAELLCEDQREDASMQDHDLVRVRELIPEVLVDLRYAGPDNFTGQTIYTFHDAYLRRGTAMKLAAAQSRLRQMGMQLKIWDAFRPVSAQFRLWEVCPNSTYVANPHKGFSSHSRGNAVDVTLADAQGRELPMPTEFDCFSSLANRDYSDVKDPGAARNAKLLEDVMTESGFKPYFDEWWHYSDTVVYDPETREDLPL